MATTPKDSPVSLLPGHGPLPNGATSRQSNSATWREEWRRRTLELAKTAAADATRIARSKGK